MASPNTSNPVKDSASTSRRRDGFTLIEVLVVVGILVIILNMGLAIDFSAFRSDTFRAERATILSVLERARSRSLNNMFNSSHGVCYIAPNYVIFRGSTCDPLNPDNELIAADQKIAVASDFANPAKFPTIIFAQLTAVTSVATIHLTDGIKSADIVTNYEGTINW